MRGRFVAGATYLLPPPTPYRVDARCLPAGRATIIPIRMNGQGLGESLSPPPATKLDNCNSGQKLY